MKGNPRASAIFNIAGPEDTLRLAKILAGLLKGGETVCLKGIIGAGKTFFVKGIALALGSKDAPASASFNIMRTYRGGGINIYHFDLFRIAGAEMDNLGLEDYLGRADGFAAIEWSGPARHLYGRGDFLELDFKMAGGDRRKIKASAKGSSAAGILKGMGKIWRRK